MPTDSPLASSGRVPALASTNAESADGRQANRLMASGGENGWLQRRRIRVMAVAHPAVQQQDHDPHLLAKRIRRTEWSVDGIWFVHFRDDNRGYVGWSETNDVSGGPKLPPRYALCVPAKHKKREGVMGSKAAACGLMVPTRVQYFSLKPIRPRCIR
jgi:hypothetical protein